MPKILVSFPTEIEAVDIPAGHVHVIGRQIPGYRIATELVGKNIKLYDLARVAPTLLERHYADLRNPELRERVGEAHDGYFFEAISAAVGPIEGERQIEVPEGYLPVTVVSPVEEFTYDKETGLWYVKGTNRIQKVLPPEGYQSGFDKDFWPTKTLKDRKAAIRALRDQDFSEDDAEHFASYFWRRSEYNDFAAVGLRWYWLGRGPRYLYAGWCPDDSDDDLGVRAVERETSVAAATLNASLPSAEREAGL